MPSANQSLGSSGFEFEADTTQRIATMRHNGGMLTNVGSGLIGVNFEGNDVGTVTHAAAIVGGSGTVVLDPGASVPIPNACQSFTFKADGSGRALLYSA